MLERLSRELIDNVVFGMENQERDYYLDLAEGTVVGDDELLAEAGSERYVAVPPWRSVDGYNLMERFVASLHNPIFRERLRAILASGRGVFRQYKDALKERPEIERLWFSFKEREMRLIVTEWFNDYREQQGLERLAPEIEETDQLIASDFVFVEPGPDVAASLDELDREGFLDCFPDQADEMVDHLYDLDRRAIPSMVDPASRLLAAETPGGELAGFIWCFIDSSEESRIATIVQIVVVEEFRGLGLAKVLIGRLLGLLVQEAVGYARFTLPGRGDALESSLRREGFVSERLTLGIDVGKWARENQTA